MKKLIGTLTVAGMLAFGAPNAAEAQEQTGLVNVNIGEVTILEDVAIGIAAQVVVQLCGVQVGNVGIVAAQIARQTQETFCEVEEGPETGPVTVN